MCGKIVILLLLGVNALRDIRRGEICLYFTLGILLAGAVRYLFPVPAGRSSLLTAAELGLALVPGAAALALAFLTGGKIGAGDGMVLLAAGFWTSPAALAAACLTALAMVPAAAALSSLSGHVRKEWPFVPFLCAAWLAAGWLA